MARVSHRPSSDSSLISGACLFTLACVGPACMHLVLGACHDPARFAFNPGPVPFGRVFQVVDLSLFSFSSGNPFEVCG